MGLMHTTWVARLDRLIAYLQALLDQGRVLMVFRPRLRLCRPLPLLLLRNAIWNFSFEAEPRQTVPVAYKAYKEIIQRQKRMRWQTNSCVRA